MNIQPFIDFIKRDFANGRNFLLMIAMGFLIAYNYTVDLEDTVLALYQNNWKGILGFFLLFAGAYWIGILIVAPKKMGILFRNKIFLSYFFATFLLIALYQGTQWFVMINGDYSKDYFLAKLQNRWDSLLMYALMILILGVWLGKSKMELYGLKQWNFKKKIYLYLLLAMVPLVAWAATQPEFLAQYPNLKPRYFTKEEYPMKFLLYEPFYLMDFIGVEWLFRGFIVLAFLPFLNEKTVVLAASVYCIFHFGKPMMECISSFFGGYILGYLSYRTKSIWGGIFVHMGIALMMDSFAFFNTFVT